MLELKNVCFNVDDNKKQILKNINLIINDSKFTAITGPNGGGKSTLAKIISGIKKPTSGSIIFDGKDITNMSITERAKFGISFAFQQPVRFKGITVKDLLTFAAQKDISKKNICEYLHEVGLCAKDYINREINGSLSGGELKRIEIATILARGTKLSLFDEPEAGIDIWSFNNMIKVFEKMRKDINKSIIIISHQERILNIADDIILIEGGEIKKHGKKDDILPELLSAVDNCKFYKGDI
ncbi:ABC transporter ATP-binding protein [Clostridium sporogenes]|uniref:ABC transporter ATP-binding protein n=1 Tax=Clostridium sporogenes TaxID=1509 RepID=A0ABX4K501_CLOSG|nr:ATP-binding cassette domain-containing protein [Clostridium sporogenes]MBW5458748.1 ATP-binding cassette domain-containing protein [Clostridium sporogenes]NFF62612.1 ATP-binding cassette domain-containing protein [Clostridium sporogenes]NFM15820.1 ATP-binding cassette domain-containing protein [Clostridium sporogenes]NFQ68179.1 ATP-binding cassette domain-containing protein [Clostridium sporogenes]PHH00019.1 ABC transporter ATP-binding protein [Clostridium sporogenes]